jgi:O-antigen/teichoic acid export membrane protein
VEQPLEILEESIGTRAIKGAKWVTLSTALLRIFQPIVTIILARLLTPQDFGLVALASIAISVIALFQDLGMKPALIQRKEKTEDSASIVFFTSILLGMILYIFLFFFAPYISAFFDNEKVTPILQVMGLSFIILPFGSVQRTLLAKELDFKRLFYLNLAPAIVPGFIAILLAFYGFGVWALVYGSLTGSLLSIIILWFSHSWRPIWRYDGKLAREMLGFGGVVSLHNMVVWANFNIDNLIIGKWLGMAALGIYRIGFNIARWPSANITGSLTHVMYPTFSNLQDNRGELKRIYLKIIKHISLISFPMGIGIAITAPQFVPVLLGEKWIAAIPVIQILSIAGILGSIGRVMPQLCRAIGRPEIYLKFSLVRLVIAIPVYLLVVQFGIIALCFAQLTLFCTFVPTSLFIGTRVLKIKYSQIIGALWLSVVCALGTGVISFVLMNALVSVKAVSDVTALALIVALFLLLYVNFIYLVNRETFNDMRNLFVRAFC